MKDMEWISVNERLPERFDTVIIPGGVGYFDNGIWYTITGERYPGCPVQWEVKCWMPFPKSPLTS